MRWIVGIILGAMLALQTGCDQSSDAVMERTREQLDTYRELRGWLLEDLGDRSGLRVTSRSIDGFVLREEGWIDRNDRDAGAITLEEVAQRIDIAPDRIQRYLATLDELGAEYVMQQPNDHGAAFVYLSSTGAWSGCSGFLYWGSTLAERTDSEQTALEDDFFFQWMCEQ